MADAPDHRTPSRLTWLHVAGATSIVAAVWSLSSVGYYLLEPLLHVASGYTEAPVTFVLYYLGWSLFVGLFFRSCYLSWAATEQPPQDVSVVVVEAMLFAGFALFVLPRLPEITAGGVSPMPELFVADWWYFLPKSVEILFQQILIVALVLHLHRIGLPLRQIALLTAALFGGFHLSLALSDNSAFYVARYTVASTLFGLLAPYLMLRVRSGFFLSYGLHWGFYAADTTAAHLLFGQVPGPGLG